MVGRKGRGKRETETEHDHGKGQRQEFSGTGYAKKAHQCPIKNQVSKNEEKLKSGSKKANVHRF
jgi:hypothetical protein